MILPLVSIVVPCYKSSKKELDRLALSIKNLDYPINKLQLVVVNIKRDAFFPKVSCRVKHLKCKATGYGEAANLGIIASKGNYILLINSDVELAPNLVKKFINFYSSNKNIGVVGPVIYSRKQFSQIDKPVISFNRYFGNLDSISFKELKSIGNNALEVSWVSGCVMFFSRSIFKKVNGFDNKYFMYWEDADYCMKAKNLGYTNYVLSNTYAYHRGSASVGANNPARYYYNSRNGLMFIFKFGYFTSKVICILKSFVITLKIYTCKDKNAFQLAIVRGYHDFIRNKNEKSSNY